jgi:hypothetical protein
MVVGEVMGNHLAMEWEDDEPAAGAVPCCAARKADESRA